MADIGQRKARLRRTFRYPSENSDPESEALDEQGIFLHPSSCPIYQRRILTIPEQEYLIDTLTAENKARNKSYTSLLLTLPLLSTIAYIRLLPALPAVLSISSLLSTAFLLNNLPPTVTGIAVLDKKQTDKKRKGEVLMGAHRSPLEMWLPYLNIGLAALSCLSLKGGTLGILPGILYGVVIVAKMVMGSVDPGELEGLKYPYKGA